MEERPDRRVEAVVEGRCRGGDHDGREGQRATRRHGPACRSGCRLNREGAAHRLRAGRIVFPPALASRAPWRASLTRSAAADPWPHRRLRNLLAATRRCPPNGTSAWPPSPVPAAGAVAVRPHWAPSAPAVSPAARAVLAAAG